MPLLAVDERDRRAARRRGHVRRVVGHQPEVVLVRLDLPQLGRADRAVLDRDLVLLARPVVGDRQGLVGGTLRRRRPLLSLRCHGTPLARCRRSLRRRRPRRHHQSCTLVPGSIAARSAATRGLRADRTRLISRTCSCRDRHRDRDHDEHERLSMTARTPRSPREAGPREPDAPRGSTAHSREHPARDVERGLRRLAAASSSDHRGGEPIRSRPSRSRRPVTRRSALIAALGRRALALVVAAELRAPVRPQRRAIERHERELRDRQARVQLDRDAREVVQLERQRPLPAGVAEAGRRVDDQTEAAELESCPRSGPRCRPAARPIRASARGRTRRDGSRTTPRPGRRPPR